ncbi:putative bacteriodes thetaiotaomicron symbiotic chitinase [Daldinia decipiens]|uniref:putative bacteriodes thetaiotaomicron symbiotic chitinase n=1 Tax=Daldinia decipiens TaxID=326647 RepID=UPI0020C1BD07|nr:putative bacteriodes thetaiotaomicron symbiotic chitinase [Daldinia decipiens]KAI1658123.1 putative bacteriodes thetaiotaomicron symbiotic chitinase [Daldinia decipiens]
MKLAARAIAMPRQNAASMLQNPLEIVLSTRYGFCGVTDEFCGDGCQPNSDGGGCGAAPRPKDCTINTDALSYARRIGYYELFATQHDCNVFEPEDIVVAGLTHLNLAFVNFGDDFKLQTGDGSLIYRASLLKVNNPGLHVCISVGGWDFNDPPDQALWSHMANDYTNRQMFISSVVDFLKKYGLDGIDLDWEYPSASDRGGVPSDADAFVLLVSDLRDAFDSENPGWTISVTLPTSYWYLRGFDVKNMQKYVSWFNLMSYDLHGTWDHDNKWTGPYLKGHTDISEIDLGLDLLWRNGVDPAKVVFGMGFYGRSFTMADPNCYEPNGDCEFATGGRAGTCSNTVGILTYQEIAARNGSLDIQTFYNSTTTVKFNVYDGDQWISYDDEESWHDKKAFLSKRCLSGLMIWALDQDNSRFEAYNGVMGDTSLLELEGSGLSPEATAQLADQFAAYTGQNCFVTPRCTDGSPKEQGPQQVCPGGYQSVSAAHTPRQVQGHDYFGECSEGWWRNICCPKDALPKNCRWVGAPERSEIGCSGSCGSTQFELNADSYLDAKGEKSCYYGTRSLCCDSTELISDCYWSPCQGPILTNPECNDGYTFEGYRLDKPDGTPWCSDTYISPVGGIKGSPVHGSFRSALCCPEKQAWTNCDWSNNVGILDPEHVCMPSPCGKNKIQIGTALDPPPSPAIDSTFPVSCDGVVAPPGRDRSYPLCCDLQSKYNKKWPVDPEKVFQTYYNTPGDSDVVWQYSDEYTNNNKDDGQSSSEDGTDAYGFLMLDGPEGSIDSSFSTTNTIVRKEAAIPRVKRSLVTYNQTVMDTVFDHTEETFQFYCNFPAGSAECNRLWIDGAEDTIIRMPDYIGEGPFARVVSIRELETDKKGFGLPAHHIKHRALQGIHNTNPVYEIKIDYNFLAITPKRDDQPVYLRVDYTNLLGYWDEVEAADPGKKRSNMPSWQSRVKRAAERDRAVRKRSTPINVTAPMDPIAARCGNGNADAATLSVEKRWWGAIGGWVKKLTTVEKSDLGVIPLAWRDTINLFSAQWGCPGQTFSANLRMDLEAMIQMDATYAYYFQGQFIPPKSPEVYAYLGMQPSAYVGLHLVGNAVMQYTSGRKKIIDTLAYPGLAVKGIAAVGPTLDVYGEIRGKITIHGEANAGALLNFDKAEVYWPSDAAESKSAQQLLGLDDTALGPDPDTIAPTFEAGVELDAQLDVIITPEANIGIKIGGGSLVSATIMDAQLTGYLMGDLSFQASGQADTNTGNFQYSYGVYAFYNIGYKATAVTLGLVNWATGPQQAFTPDKRINIYGPISGEIPLHSKRGLKEPHDVSENITIGSGLSLLPRTDDDDDGLSPKTPDFTQQLSCPPGSSADVRLPELRFNCDLFGPVQVLPFGSGPSYLQQGMCDGWKTMSPRPTVLTYSTNSIRNTQRRNYQCPSGYCKNAQQQLIDATGRDGSSIARTTPLLECDEAPWASTEEGGDWLPSNERSATCVPGYQNGGWAGSSCQKIVGDLSTNWGRLDPTLGLDDSQKVDNWRRWRADTNWWTTITDKKASVNQQRPVKYFNVQPKPDGMDQPEPQTSWLFRRNYTWSLVEDTADASQWWGATGREFVTKSYRGPSGWDSVLCALNTFGQDNLFKIDAGSDYNGYCLRGPQYTTKGWQYVYHVARCKITFGTVTKRGINGSKAAGTEDEWSVRDVKFVDTPEDEKLSFAVPVAKPNPLNGIDNPNIDKGRLLL